MAMLASENVSFGKLAELIEKDTVVAGNVLRMVNSALYGRRGEVSSVRHAVSLMGVVKLRNTVMTLSMSQMWNSVRMPKGWNSARFNQHAVGVAVMADLIAQKADIDYPEGAFVAGLLHDIGLLLLGIALPGEFVEIRRLHEAGGRPVHECEEEVLGLGHAELSAVALHRWNLPDQIQKAVRYQHRPTGRTGGQHSLSLALHVADSAVSQLGLTALDGERESREDPEEMLASIGLNGQWPALRDQFEHEFEPMKSFF